MNVFTARKRGYVIFSQVFVCPQGICLWGSAYRLGGGGSASRGRGVCVQGRGGLPLGGGANQERRRYTSYGNAFLFGKCIGNTWLNMKDGCNTSRSGSSIRSTTVRL